MCREFTDTTSIYRSFGHVEGPSSAQGDRKKIDSGRDIGRITATRYTSEPNPNIEKGHHPTRSRYILVGYGYRGGGPIDRRQNGIITDIYKPIPPINLSRRGNMAQKTAVSSNPKITDVLSNSAISKSEAWGENWTSTIGHSEPKGVARAETSAPIPSECRTSLKEASVYIR